MMKTIQYIVSLLILLFITSCKGPELDSKNDDQIKQHLISLERNWLQHEFALDTAAISPLLDSTFISISATDTSNKAGELSGIYNNIGAIRRDSIFIDSFRIEEPVVNVYENSAIVIFICHTFKKERGRPIEKRTKFYDAWVKRSTGWKAIASQATVVEETK